MKTVVFHSYKGGSGRTLALANIAYLLQMTGRRVLLMDMDFDAPGLAYRMNVSKKITNGYIGYLDATSPETRASGKLRQRRIDHLRKYIVEIPSSRHSSTQPPIKLLSCGNPESNEYWTQLGSPKIQQVFGFEMASVRGGGIRSGPELNWEAFRQDLDDIEEAAEYPDFCLVDCRSIRDTVSPALWVWADHVVEFFHCNLEGVLGLHLLLHRLYRGGVGNGPAMFTPVVTRVPNFMKDDVRGKVLKLARKIRGNEGDGQGINAAQLEHLVVLSEQQAVEIGDLDVIKTSRARRNKYSLAHEYASLFARVVEGEEKAIRQSLKTSIGLDRTKEVADRMFGHLISKGYLLNKDDEENVALRKKTLTILINSILSGLYRVGEGDGSQIAPAIVQNILDSLYGEHRNNDEKLDPSIVKVFYRAGLQVGHSFGDETSRNPSAWRNGIRPADVDDRLAQWCEFDGQAGLGMWTASWNASAQQATLRLKNHFLDEVERDLGLPFLLGYLEGVLEYVLADAGRLSVEFVSEPRRGLRRQFRFKIK